MQDAAWRQATVPLRQLHRPHAEGIRSRDLDLHVVLCDRLIGLRRWPVKGATLVVHSKGGRSLSSKSGTSEGIHVGIHVALGIHDGMQQPGFLSAIPTLPPELPTGSTGLDCFWRILGTRHAAQPKAPVSSGKRDKPRLEASICLRLKGCKHQWT